MPKKRTAHHHIVPKSRGGEVIVTIPVTFHRAWHVVFHNLYGDECAEFVQLLHNAFNIKGRLTNADIEKLRQKARR